MRYIRSDNGLTCCWLLHHHHRQCLKAEWRGTRSIYIYIYCSRAKEASTSGKPSPSNVFDDDLTQLNKFANPRAGFRRSASRAAVDDIIIIYYSLSLCLGTLFRDDVISTGSVTRNDRQSVDRQADRHAHIFRLSARPKWTIRVTSRQGRKATSLEGSCSRVQGHPRCSFEGQNPPSSITPKETKEEKTSQL